MKLPLPSAATFELELLEPRILLSADAAVELAHGLSQAVTSVISEQHAAAPGGYKLPVADPGLADAYDPSAQLEGLLDWLKSADTSSPETLANALQDRPDTTAAIVAEDADSVTLQVGVSGTMAGVTPAALTPESTGLAQVDLTGNLTMSGEWRLDLRITAAKAGGEESGGENRAARSLSEIDFGSRLEGAEFSSKSRFCSVDN